MQKRHPAGLRHFIALLAYLSLSACAPEPTFEGEWVGAVRGEDTVVTIAEDGTLFVVWGQKKSVGTWFVRDDGLIQFMDGDSEEGIAEIVDGKLQVTDDKVTFTLVRNNQ